MYKLPPESRPAHYATFAVIAFLWAAVGPTGYAMAIAFVATAAAWVWLTRRSLGGLHLLEIVNRLSMLWFVLGAIMVISVTLGFVLRSAIS